MRRLEKTVHILNYIGSKARMSEALSSMIPKDCNIYAELFCGSAALALNSRSFEVKILNDANPHIVNFWAVATNPETRTSLLKRIQEVEYSNSHFEEAKQRKQKYGTKRADKLEWAVDTFVLNSQSYNASSEYWVYKDSEEYRKNLTGIFGLPLAFKTLEGQAFRVYNETALDCMEQEHLLQNEKAFIFLDPPYLEKLRSDTKLYEVDMPDVRDHIKLLKAIKNAKANIILSGYWSGRDDGTDLYDYYLLPNGWHRHLLGEYTKGCEAGEVKSKGAEWIWTNFDISENAQQYLKSYNDDTKSKRICEWISLENKNVA